MSNQFISDKKRADLEDELRDKYNIDVRILDRSWILEAVFKHNNKDIAINAFGLSDNFCDQIDIGAEDLKRKKELSVIEGKLSEPHKISPKDLIYYASRSVVLNRELEIPKEMMLNLLNRQRELANKYGTNFDISEAIYDYAWTIFWWYGDVKLYYEKYLEYEAIANSESDVEYIKNLATLWINLYVIAKENLDIINIDRHTKLVVENHLNLIRDKSNPNSSLEARASYQIIRIILREDEEDIANQYIDILKNSDGTLNLKIDTIEKIVTKLPCLKETSNYNHLFEILIDTVSNRANEVRAARMLITRGKELKKEPYESLVYFSRALNLLIKEESKNELFFALVNIGLNMQEVGCYWAARNFFIYACCLSLNQYLKFGELHPAMKITTNGLKKLELKFGRLIYAVEFHWLQLITEKINGDEIDIKENDLFDYMLGKRMLESEVTILNDINGLSNYLLSYRLDLSETAYKYLYGKYDKQMLDKFSQNKEHYDYFMEKWYKQSLMDEMSDHIFWGIEKKCVFTSKISGCKIIVKTDNDDLSMELGSTILASLESFYVTGTKNGLIAIWPEVNILIKYQSNDGFSVSCNRDEHKENCILIKCSDYKKQEIVDAQERLHEFLIEVLALFTSMVFPFNIAKETLESMVKNENALGRAYTFANSIFYVREAFGTDMFTFNKVVDKENLLDLERTRTLFDKMKEDDEVDLEKNIKEICYTKPPKEDNFENTVQDNIYIDTIIDVPLWDKAKWQGNMYLTSLRPEIPPVLSLIYSNEIGKKDIKDKIKVGIINILHSSIIIRCNQHPIISKFVLLK